MLIIQKTKNFSIKIFKIYYFIATRIDIILFIKFMKVTLMYNIFQKRPLESHLYNVLLLKLLFKN